MTHTEWNKSY